MTKKPKKITFLQYASGNDPHKFLLCRVADQITTHYMGPDGMWIAFPADDVDVEPFLMGIEESGALPQFDDLMFG